MVNRQHRGWLGEFADKNTAILYYGADEGETYRFSLDVKAGAGGK